MSEPSNIQPGKHLAKALSAEVTESGTGTPCVQVVFEISTDEAMCQGEHITWWGYLTEKASERTLKALTLMGWKGDDIRDLSGVGEKEVILVVEEDTFEGKTRMKVKWINDPNFTGSGAPQIEKGKLDQLATRLKQQALAIKQSGSANGTDFPHGANAPKPATKKAAPKVDL